MTKKQMVVMVDWISPESVSQLPSEGLNFRIDPMHFSELLHISLDMTAALYILVFGGWNQRTEIFIV